MFPVFFLIILSSYCLHEKTLNNKLFFFLTSTIILLPNLGTIFRFLIPVVYNRNTYFVSVLFYMNVDQWIPGHSWSFVQLYYFNIPGINENKRRKVSVIYFEFTRIKNKRVIKKWKLVTSSSFVYTPVE